MALYKEFVCAGTNTYMHYTCSSDSLYLEGCKTLAKGKLEVPVLDATAITISIARGDVSTASSVMFLLGIGEILEEWTHKSLLAILQEACL